MMMKLEYRQLFSKTVEQIEVTQEAVLPKVAI